MRRRLVVLCLLICAGTAHAQDNVVGVGQVLGTGEVHPDILRHNQVIGELPLEVASEIGVVTNPITGVTREIRRIVLTVPETLLTADLPILLNQLGTNQWHIMANIGGLGGGATIYHDTWMMPAGDTSFAGEFRELDKRVLWLKVWVADMVRHGGGGFGGPGDYERTVTPIWDSDTGLLYHRGFRYNRQTPFDSNTRVTALYELTSDTIPTTLTEVYFGSVNSVTEMAPANFVFEAFGP